jgi:hypothetical protein
MFSSLLGQFDHFSRKIHRLRALSGSPTRARPLFEHLESRDLPAPLTWFPAPNLPVARGGAVAAADQGAAFTFLGGGPSDVLTVEPADPAWAAISWSDPSFEDRTSISPGVGILGSASLLVFGGDQGGAVADAIQYDTATGPQVVASMHTPRELMGYATDQQANVYAIGGIDDNGTPLASVEYYTQSTNTWTFAAPLPQTLYADSAAYDGNGHIFTFGGVGSGGTILSTVYEYTIATNTWSQMASMPSAVRDSAAVLASNNLIYVLGGNTSTGTTAAVESYNPATNTWNTEASLPAPVSSTAVVSDSLGRIEILGGFDASGNALANVWVSQRLNAPDSVPSITTSPPTTGRTAVLYSYQVFSTANPQATYSLSTAPTGMSIDPGTGLVQWTPTGTQTGSIPVTVVASNYAEQTSQSFTINVTQSPPTIPTGLAVTGTDIQSLTYSWNPSTGPLGVDHYNVYHYYATGHSGRGGGITYHHDLVGSTTGTSFTITGLYSGRSYQYQVEAFDPNGLGSGYSAPVTGTTLPDTVPPVLTTPSNQTVEATSPAGATDANAFTATATDPGPGIDSLTISYTANGVIISPTYVFPVGVTTVTATVRDLYGNSASGSFTVTVNSSFPVITLPPNQLVEQTSSAGATDANAFTATATDAQDPIASITYSVNAVTIDPSYVFAPGTTTVTVTATDVSGNSNSGTFTVTVEDIPPTVTLTGLPPNNNTVYEGTAINVTANATAGTSAENAYGLTFTWNVTKVHNGVTTNNYYTGGGQGSSDQIAFVADDEGSYILNVTATDVNGTSTTVSATITSWPLEPTLTMSGPSDGVVYQNRLFTFTASSPSPIDQSSPFIYNINWGDGNSQTITGGSSIVVGHAYTATGSYTVYAYPTDAGGYFGPTSSQSVTINTIEQQSDPARQGGIAGLAIGGTSGNDAFVISTGSASGTITVTLNGASLGTFTPTGGGISVYGGPGTNGVTFNARSGAGTFSLNGQTLSYSNSGTGVPLFNLSLYLAPDISNLAINGGNTASSYRVQDTTIATSITAGSGNDTFTLADTGAATQPVAFNGGSGTNTLIGANLNNSWSITASNTGTVQAAGEPADAFSSIQNLDGGSASDTFAFASNTASISGSLNGGAGSNTLDFSARTTAVTVTLQSTGLNRSTAISGTFTNITSLVGSSATTNSLIGPNIATSWTISGTNAGTVGSLPFSGFENLTGGSAADTFAFTGAGSISGNLNGGSGVNTLDVSGYSSPATINLQTKKATPIAGTFSNVTSFVGDNATSTLVGANTTNTWTITSANAGHVGSFSFSKIANLTGGTGVDTFKISTGGSISGTINGGGAPANQGDWLDYSSFSGPVTVNLATGAATSVNGGAAGGIIGIQDVHGGNGGNTLTGNSQGNILIGGTGTNTITGGSGRSLLIADRGVSNITGGSGGSANGGDILIAGYTSYDTVSAANQAALMSILAEWQSSDSYATRFSDINTGTGGGLNGSSKLNYGTTVIDNGKVNTLTAQPGTAIVDWFFGNFASGHTTINNFETGEHQNNT